MPNKSCLRELTIKLLERTGLHLDNGAECKLYIGVVDPDVTVLFARTINILEYVRDGAVEAGIAELGQVRESGHELGGLLDLECGKCRLILATPKDGDIETVADILDKVVAAEFPYITRTYFEEEGADAGIVEVTGVTELTPHVGMVGTIIDITSTGTTLWVSRLVVIDEVLSSSVRLLACPGVVDDLKVQQLFMALESIRSVKGKRYLMTNAPREKLDRAKEVILDLDGLTVMDVAGDSTVAVHTIMNERDVFEVVSDLKDAGMSGILVTEVERLIG